MKPLEFTLEKDGSFYARGMDRIYCVYRLPLDQRYWGAVGVMDTDPDPRVVMDACTAAHEARVLSAIEPQAVAWNEAFKLHYAPAHGVFSRDLADAVPSDLWKIGDVHLIFVNEGDLATLANAGKAVDMSALAENEVP